MKDEGSFLWPDKDAVLMAGHCISTVEKLLDKQEWLEKFVTLSIMNHAALIALK